MYMEMPASFQTERATAVPRRISWTGAASLGSDLGSILGTAVLPFVLVVYLGLKGGGYDSVVRSEVGIAAWWIVLVGVAAGLLPVHRVPRWAAISLVGLLAFGIWTAIAISWSDSAERSVAEVTRVAALLGVFAVAIALQGPGGLRRTLGGVGAAVAVLATLAVGSRVHPGWFPENTTAEFLDTAQSRLNWPLNYWNGLAALMTLGVPLLLALAASCRTTVCRGLAAGAIPILVLATFLTLSRGGAVELGIAVLVFMALTSHRLAILPGLLISGAGGAILVVAAAERKALTDGLDTPAGLQQGDELALLAIVVAAGVALLTMGLTFAHRSGLVRPPEVPRRATQVACASLAIIGVIAFFALGGPGEVSDGFAEFKSSENSVGSDLARFQSVDGSLRWQIWGSAVDANASAPLIGIGPGTFEYWWAANGSEGNFVRDAHSLYLETLGELGIVGLLLLLGFFAAVFTGMTSRLRGSSGSDRILLAGAIASGAAFLTAAAIDWVWELTVIPAVILLVVAAALGGTRRPAGYRADTPQAFGLPMRIAVPVIAALAMVAIALPLGSTQELRASQTAAQRPDVAEALSKANSARDLQPFAASPTIQQAVVLELDGRLGAAAGAARRATEQEPTNWRTWFVLARIEAERGNADSALGAYLRARDLNPRSALFEKGDSS